MKNSSFAKQAAILAAATLLARLIGFLYRLPLTNLIGDAGNALHGVGYQFYMFLLVLSAAGLPGAISKMVSERIALNKYRSAHAVFRTALVLAAGVGIAAALILWIMAGFLAESFGFPGSVYAIRGVAPAIPLVSVMAVFRGYFQGMGNATPTAVTQVVEQFFNAIFKVLLAYLFIAQLEHAAGGAAAGTAISAAIGLLVIFCIYKMLAPKILERVKEDPAKMPEDSAAIIKELLRITFPIILGTAIFSIANFIDIAMVGNRMTASGAFTQAEIENLFGQLPGKFVVLTTLPISISTAIATASLPSIAGSKVVKDLKAVRQKIANALRLSTLISIPAAVGIGVLAEPILALLFPNHPEGAILLQVGSVSIVFLSLTQIATGSLQGIGKIMIPVGAAAAGAIIKIPLNHVLIANPQINVLGAVISTCACYLLAATINLTAVKKFTGIKIDWITIFAKPLIAASMMGLASFVSHNVVYTITLGLNWLATIFAIGIGMTIYFVVLVVLGALSREDMGRIPIIKRYV